MKRLNVVLSDADHKALHLCANVNNTTISTLVRQWIAIMLTSPVIARDLQRLLGEQPDAIV